MSVGIALIESQKTIPIYSMDCRKCVCLITSKDHGFRGSRSVFLQGNSMISNNSRSFRNVNSMERSPGIFT